MSKRKRGDSGSISKSYNNGSGCNRQIFQRQIESAIQNGIKTVFRALKVARGFERQKLGRRQKLANGKEAIEEKERLSGEVAALKGLNFGSIAQLHVYKTLVKVKSIATNPAFVSHLTPPLQSSTVPLDTAHTNVTARLYNSNPVKEAIQEILTTVYGILGLKGQEPHSKRRVRAKGLNDVDKVNTRERPTPVEGDELTPITCDRSNITSESPQWNGFSDLEISLEAEVETNEENDVDDDEYQQYALRLASSSSEAECGDDSAENSTTWSEQSRYSPIGDTALSPSELVSLSDTSFTDVISKRLKPSKPATSTNVQSTTFLPMLMGGYYSGSDSGSEMEDDDTSQVKPRKNRMGQQARRQLWEKKFGQKANHVKTQSRDQGWDPRRGAQGDESRGKRGRGMAGRNARPLITRNVRGQQTTGANSDPIKARVNNRANIAEGPLHPSWEAAKKAKEQKVTASFAGKKIVFD